MSRQEDFIQAGIKYRFGHGKPMAIGGDNFADVANEMNRTKPFEAGAEYGYQYALQHHQWIPVEKELPKERGWYLVATPTLNSKIDVALWDGKWFRLIPITHWMPLPQPPRKEE